MYPVNFDVLYMKWDFDNEEYVGIRRRQHKKTIACPAIPKGSKN